MIFHLSSTNSTPYHGAMVPQQWFLSLVLIFLLFQLCTSADTVTPTQSVTGDQILVSKGENFALGFFSPANSTNRYVGIWYHKVPVKTVVWVANRDNPVQDSTGVLIINRDGNLVVLHGDRKTPLWSTNVSSTTNNTIAKLLDSGNLALCGPPSETVLWQSFDHPTNIWLPGVKLGLNQRTGLNTILTSWRSRDDPAVGDYSFGLDPRGSPQFFLYMSSARRWRTGPWNGFGFSGIPAMRLSYIVKDIFVSHSDEIYWEWTIPNSSILSTFILNESGLVQRQGWLEEIGRWNVFGSFPRDRCDEYRRCEGYGICNNENIAECECLPGFEPKSSELWYMRDWSGGCVRKRTLECGKGEGFLKLSNVKLPDTSISRVDMSLSLKDCKKDCLRNCSCTGYASADITGEGSGCIGWYGELMDIRKFTDGGQDFYVRVDAAELAQARSDSKGFLDKKRMVVILGVSIVVGVFFLVLSGYFVLKKRKTKGAIENRRTSRSLSFRDSLGSKELEDSRTNPELPIFELNVVVAATDNFSSSNKLGEGGFGSVYKGLLSNGQEIAVKRLSKKSGQGVEEFKNEVRSIAQLQHRNLVRLLGCCIQEEEKMLIYEYMPNKSLDTFIFDQSRKALLSWRRRFEIIVGIARGILYLHQDSRLRIIHRDLKASNVLLDAEMTPKISDFGMARIFGGNQSEANTNRVVGTYGYMSPEYAMEGQFSIKSDVYSFGVLLLEIISGKKNNDYYQEDPSLNLIGHAWDRWRESKVWNIVDSSIRDLCPTHEVLRCIQVALLCVQESALDRPTMSQVVYMLDNETTMPPPKRPAFVMRTIKNTDSMSTGAGSSSVNEVMITEIEAR